MKGLTVAAFAALLLAAAGAEAAPRAESELECSIAADMAVVAHSLAREEVQRPQAGKIMARIYDVAESERGKEIMKEILDAAYGSQTAAAGGGSAQTFAEELFTACVNTGGNLDGVLGKSL
jgi:lipopolysaccharide export LptBFGC system permease protein LptF